MKKNRVLVIGGINDFPIKPQKSRLFEKYISFNRIFYSLLLLPKLKKLQKKNDVIFLCTDLKTQQMVSKEGIDSRLIFDYKVKGKGEISDEIMPLIENSKFSKKMKKITKFRNTSLFDLLEESLHTYLVKSVEMYETLDTAIKKEKPDKILSLNKNSFFGRIARIIAMENAVEISYPRPLFLPLLEIKEKAIEKMFPFIVKFSIKKTFSNRTTNSLKRNKKRKIIIFTSALHHTGIISPLVTELQKNPENDVLVVGPYDNMINEYEDRGIKFNLLRNYTTEKIFKEVEREKASLKKKWKELNKYEELKNSIKYRNVKLWEIIKDKLILLFFNLYPRVVEYFETMYNAIETEEPDLIVVLNERNMFGKTAILAGKLNGKRALCLQHGVFGNIVRKPNIADKIGVFGDYDKKLLMERGIEKDVIVVTGQTRFDAIYNKKFNKKNVYRRLKIDLGKKIVVFTTGLADPTQESVITEIIKTTKEFPEIQLVLKLHPTDPPDIPKRLIEKYKSDAKITKDIDLHELLNSCEMMLTEHSTTWLDASVLGKPVVVVDLGCRYDFLPCEIFGFAAGVHKKGELKEVITRMLKDKKFSDSLEKKRNEIIKEFIYKHDGKSAYRIKNLIEKMADQKD